MKRKLIGIFIIMLLIVTALPVSGISNEIKQEKNVFDTNHYKIRFYVIGIISDLKIEQQRYEFYCKNVRILIIDNPSPGGFYLCYQHMIETPYYIDGLIFKGILKPTFICAYFHLFNLSSTKLDYNW